MFPNSIFFGGGARCPTEKIFLGRSRQKIYKIKGSPKNAQKSGKSRNKKPAPYRFIHFLGEGGGVTSEMTAPWTEAIL